MPRTKSLYLPMNENQHVGKVGNAHARTGNTHADKNVWPALTYIHSVESTAICAITFSVFLSRVIWVSTRIRHDGILPSKTAETPPHKSAGPPRWFIYLLRGIELPLSTARRKWVCAYCIRKPGNCFRRNACYNITNVCGIKYLNGNSGSSLSMSMIHILTLR